VALGDSYTIGTNVGQSDRWPDQLVESVRDSVQLELVANLGVNGYTSGDLVQRELPQLADLRPGLVSILIGVNDVVRDISLERYRANVEETFAAVLELVPRNRVVVVSVPDYTRTPRGADYGDPQQQHDTIAAVNVLMKQLCDERGVAFVDISVVADQAGADATLLAGDLLHPSGAQYARWIELIAPAVEALFGE
jgi:acyl-CoA thioesterase I